jgi:hypothetical protein
MKILRRLRLSGVLAAALAGVVLVTGVSTTGRTAVPAPSAHAKSIHLDESSIRTVDWQTPYLSWNGSRWDYFGFISQIRRLENAYNNNVPGSSNTVDHTDPWNGSYFEVTIGTRYGEQVRLRFRRDNLYLVGWFTRNDVYNFVGPMNEAEIPSDHNWQNTGNGQRGGYWQLNGSSNYGSLENQAGTQRSQLNFNQWTVNSAASALLDASDSSLMAQGLLFFTQFVSEATRFRPISDRIGWGGFADNGANNPNWGPQLPGQFIDQENNWGQLSWRFNNLLQNNAQQDPNPLWCWVADGSGQLHNIALARLADFALVMNCVNGFPGRY